MIPNSAPQVDDFTAARDTFTKHDVEFGFAERRSYLVLYDFDTYLVTDDFFAVFQLSSATDVQTDRSIELRALPPVVVSGLPNITPIFSRNWLMKIQVVLVLLMAEVSLRSACDIRRACKPTLLLAHVAFDFCFRSQCCYRVDDNDVDGR